MATKLFLVIEVVWFMALVVASGEVRDVKTTEVNRNGLQMRLLQTTCPTGKYLSGSSCVSCKTGCSACSSSSVCSSCQPGYYKSGSTCNTCNSRCATCYGSLSTNCYTCNSGYYADSTYNTCSSCSKGCATCLSSSSASCTSCESNYSLSRGRCTYITTSVTSSGLSTGAYIGIGVGAGVGLIFIIVAIVVCVHKRKNTAQMMNHSRAGQPVQNVGGANGITMGTAQPMFPSSAPGYHMKPASTYGYMAPNSNTMQGSVHTNMGYQPQPVPYQPPSMNTNPSHQLPPGFAYAQGQSPNLPPGFTAQSDLKIKN